MTVLLDTGIVYAYYDRNDRWHRRAKAVIQEKDQVLMLPAPVIPEVDYLLGERLGTQARLAFYAGIIDGHYVVADLPLDGYARIRDLNRQFEPLKLGFVDAAIATLAETRRISRVGTTDRRHFAPLAAALKFEIVP
jgi:predicted nucleic acid-binding protein